jgi:hypothetical protein
LDLYAIGLNNQKSTIFSETGKMILKVIYRLLELSPWFEMVGSPKGQQFLYRAMGEESNSADVWEWVHCFSGLKAKYLKTVS